MNPKGNPYETALFSIGLMGLIIGGILVLVSPQFALIGMGLFILGSLALVGWLLTAAAKWSAPSGG